ncbi:MAG: response regulator [Gemmatimonadetes bacterium]|nr:response regulator [Gemmatimonadota bacterium]
MPPAPAPWGPMSAWTRTDGEAGLQLAREQRPDLVLLDVAIPKLDGWEVARLLKADPSTSGIPVFAVTALAMTTDRDRARELRLEGYYPKPMAPNLLLDEIDRFLAPPPG